MNTTRRLAVPAVSAGVIGGAALGLSGTANASTYPSHDQTPRTGIVAAPAVKAPPAIVAHPGKRWGRIILTSPGIE
jgi:hypothetical protein